MVFQHSALLDVTVLTDTKGGFMTVPVPVKDIQLQAAMAAYLQTMNDETMTEIVSSLRSINGWCESIYKNM